MSEILIPKLTCYVIYKPETGKYARGGVYGSLLKKPKMWSTIVNVRKHLAQYISPIFVSSKGSYKLVLSNAYNDCVIIEVHNNAIHEKTPNELIYELAEKRKKREYKNWDCDITWEK